MRAFPKFTKNATVLDLLLARKKRPTAGVLVTCTSRPRHPSPASSLSTLPAELLLLIRDHLRHSYIAAEPSYFFDELHWAMHADEATGEEEELIVKEWSDAKKQQHDDSWECELCLNVQHDGNTNIYHDERWLFCLAQYGACTCRDLSVRPALGLSNSCG